ncbi:MAG TPA: NAD(P)/FAD-dependent oxidoreductase [Chthoniobacterales bacterium]|nr:NAD(P)/FAD-dependent oxidoreductase [Chthoniobacterales bacterium]
MTEIVIVGGGAAGFFAAIAAARADGNCKVSLFERTSQFLTKVRISGGGRCNVTHALFDPRMFTTRYPRGERELISPFHRFSAEDTIAWFEARGVRLKREEDGRIFPVTDSAETVIDCLIKEAKVAGVRLFAHKGVESARLRVQGGFDLKLTEGESTACDRLLLATGGCRSIGGAELARSLGHTIEPPVPSLFSLHVAAPWLRSLPGITVSDVLLSVEKLRERGPLLITHNGISGPAVLRLSAWGARILHEKNYRFSLGVNWIPHPSENELRTEFQTRRQTEPTRRVNNSPIGAIPARLWENIVSNAGVSPETTWTSLTRAGINELIRQLRATELKVDGKSLNKEEFVTCGGVRLREINFKTMESRVAPNLYFAGELLDIDGITGGFNFQAAWTTGWIAGHAMAGVEPGTP